MSRHTAALAFAVCFFSVVAGVSFQACRSRVEFTTETLRSAVGEKYRTSRDVNSPHGFYVSEHRQLSREETANLGKYNVNQNWSDIVWIGVAHQAGVGDFAIPDGAVAITPDHFAVGDPALIAKIVTLLP